MVTAMEPEHDKRWSIPAPRNDNRMESLEGEIELQNCVQFAIGMGTKIHERLSSVDLLPCESMAAEQAVTRMIAGGAREILRATGDTIRLLAGLPDLVLDPGAAPRQVHAVNEELDDFCFDMAQPACEGTPDLSFGHFADDIDDTLARLTTGPNLTANQKPEELLAIWRMLTDELLLAQERLREVMQKRTKWAIISQGEETKRKVLKALQYGLTAAARAIDPTSTGQALPGAQSLLATSLAVREALLAFRQRILKQTACVDEEDLSRVRAAARNVNVCFIELLYDNTYKDLRANDRYDLRGLHQRVADWLGNRKGSLSEGFQILLDVGAHAQLLVAVNQRAVLKDFDVRLKQQCENGLKDIRAIAELGLQQAWLQYCDLLVDLERLKWRDNRIETFVRDELRSAMPSPDQLVARTNHAIELLAQIQV